MKMTGEYTLNASKEAVWQALNDPDVLKECIPGCESIDMTSDTSFEAVATAKVGLVKAKFKGNVELSDLDPPNGYTISGEGSGGAAGFAKGGAKVTLADAEGGGTVLSYDVDATVGGKLAQIGQRLIDGAAKKMADEFFSKFAEQVGGKVEEEPEAATAETASAESEAAKQFEAERGRSKNLIYVGLAAIAAVILWSLFG